MASSTTPVDVKELPNSFVFVVDVPGLKSDDVKIQVENDNILKISGERRRDDNKEEDVKYVRVERPAGKFLRKFNLPNNVKVEAISAACQHGLLTIVVPKLPPPQPHKPKTFDIPVATCANFNKLSF